LGKHSATQHRAVKRAQALNVGLRLRLTQPAVLFREQKMSEYPAAVNPELVGEYPIRTKSGGGYFFDEVLEYRVWCHPVSVEDDGDDYCYSFASYEEALDYSQKTQGAEAPLVLVRQLEWINEPNTGEFIHEKGERITEWRTEWLEKGARKQGDIEAFIAAR
jgi:putative acetyltransferase